MNTHAVLNAGLLILVIGILFGVLLGMSGLVQPLAVIAGIVAGGKILLPLFFGRR